MEMADLQGRTPVRLIKAMAAQPMLGAAQVETETGASRAAVLRNLDLLVKQRLVREVTGQWRFRVWAAKV
jgi:DNA-binding IclR family transcriptional regulator